jgi:hypothetical protein
MTEKPSAEQLAELKKLSKEARVPDVSEIVTSKEEAEIRIRDLKDKARMEQSVKQVERRQAHLLTAFVCCAQ